MAKLVSKTYGEALFELAVEEGREDEFLEEITTLQNVLSENPDFARLMNHPKILKEEKLKVAEDIFKGRVSDDLAGFIRLIIAKDRYSEIDEILQYFVEEVKHLKGVGVAYVTTASLLNESQKNAVEAKLIETTEYQKMEMHYSVDESLIGGMVIRIKDRVVDSSIQTKLNKLQRELLAVQV